MKKNLQIAAAAVFLVTFLFILYQWTMPQKRLRTIIIADGSSIGGAPFYVAVEKDFFREEGLEAIFDRYHYGKPAVNALLEEGADFATAAETPFVHLVLEGKSPVLLATLSKADNYHVLLSLPEAGIKKVSDLRGKRIGTPAKTSGEYFLYQLLNVHGMERNEVHIIDLEPGKMSEALSSKQVDAVSIWADMAGEIQKKVNVPLSSLNEKGVLNLYWNLYTRRDYLEENPELMEKVLRAVQKGSAWCDSHTRACQRIVANYSKLDLPVVRELWGSHEIELGLHQALVILCEGQARWYLARGKRGGPVPNFLNYLNMEALKKVNPGNITVIE